MVNTTKPSLKWNNVDCFERRVELTDSVPSSPVTHVSETVLSYTCFFPGSFLLTPLSPLSVDILSAGVTKLLLILYALDNFATHEKEQAPFLVN